MKKEKRIDISALEKDAPKHAGATALRMLRAMKNQRARLIAVVICVLAYTFFTIFTPYYSAIVVDSLVAAINDAIAAGTPFAIAWMPLGRQMTILFAMYIILATVYYLQSFLMASVAENLILTLRKRISEKLHKLPLRFFDGNQPGEVLSRVTSDLDKVSETMQTGLLKLMTSVGTLIGAVAFMFAINWLLALIFVADALVSFIITKFVAKKNLICASVRQETLSRLTAAAEEHYTGRDVIKAYNREESSSAVLGERTERLRTASRDADFLTSAVNPLIRLLSRIAQAVILLIACLRMLSGTMSLGIVQAFFQYLNIAAEPLTETSYMINSLQSALASAERTFEFLDAEEEVPDTDSPVTIDRARGNISFRNVSFGYSPDNILMHDISFDARSGQKIAIGSTGAGKTTLVNLLMRFYEVNGGKILLDGVPTTELTRRGLRSQFGMVLQDTWLFGGTIAENIAYGRPDASRDDIVRAAQMAKVDYFIRTMPQGYDTVLTSDASTLSVGQRQLLTIARVFLCDPPVLILDEATSSVDTRTEAEISKAMNALMRGRTSFVIAHRLSTIRDADIILFMAHGDIVEQGSHDELLAKGGAYADLYNSQFA